MLDTSTEVPDVGCDSCQPNTICANTSDTVELDSQCNGGNPPVAISQGHVHGLPAKMFPGVSLIYGELETALPVYLYLAPTVLGILVCINLLLFYSVVKQMTGGSSMQKSSYLLLTALAICDTLTVVAAILEVGFMYYNQRTFGGLPYDSCSTMTILERLSGIPHAASIWLTVTMAIQRYVIVRLPFKAKRLITVKSAFIAIVCIVIFSIGFHICKYLDFEFEESEMCVIHNNISRELVSCKIAYKDWVQYPKTYEIVFMSMNVGMVHILPCLIVIALGVAMVISLKTSARRLNRQDTPKPKLGKDRARLGLFVILASCVLCSVELPTGIILLFLAIHLYTGHTIIARNHIVRAAIGLDIALYVSYCCVFVIYCVMSRDIRMFMRRCWRKVSCLKLYRKSRSDIVSRETNRTGLSS